MGNRTQNALMNTCVADRILTELQIDEDCRALIFNFFVAFSRFESLLIEKDYTQPNNDGSVDVNWDAFIGRCNDRAGARCVDLVRRHQDFLNNQPPRKLFPSTNPPNLEWRLSPADQTALTRRLTNGPDIRDFGSLTILLRRVRNNLFHGGKFRDPAQQTSARMRETLPILADLYDLLRDVGIR